MFCPESPRPLNLWPLKLSGPSYYDLRAQDPLIQEDGPKITGAFMLGFKVYSSIKGEWALWVNLDPINLNLIFLREDGPSFETERSNFPLLMNCL